MTDIPEGASEVVIPPWLHAKADQAMETIKRLGILQYAGGSFDVVVLPMLLPSPGMTERQLADLDYTCDKCGQVKGRVESMQCGAVEKTMTNGTDKIKVSLVYGLCQQCKLPPKG